jgi:CubicO group peptidase (beta-lactamase class C family)
MPVNDQTLFEIGSTTKAFTSTLVAMLVSDGKMRYDDRISTFLPDFKLYDPVASAEVTIRDALLHRTGIGRGDAIWLGAGISRAEVLHRIRFLKPESIFRSKYSYENMMYMAVGEAAGRAAGSTWDDLVRQRIFVPLGMTSTVTTSVGLTNRNLATPHGLDHDTLYTKPLFQEDATAPAGSILSNARDMAQWLRFQLNDGVVNGKRLVSSAALRETHTPQILLGGGGGRGGDSATASSFNAYGMAWEVWEYRHHVMWSHGGNTTGMTASVSMLPDQKMGVVVLSSMQGAQLNSLLSNYIFDRQLGVPSHGDPSAEAYARVVVQRRRADSTEKAQTPHTPGAQPPLPLTAYTGTFADSMYGEAVVSIKDGRLEFARGSQHGPLEFWNTNNFRWTMLPVGVSVSMFIKFDVTPDGKVSGLYFGTSFGNGDDTDLLSRKNPAAAGGRGGRGARGGGGAGSGEGRGG